MKRLLIVVACLLAVAGVLWVVLDGNEEPAKKAPSSSGTPEPSQRTRDRAVLKPTSPDCPTRVDEPFSPRTITVPAIHASAGVVTPPRDAADVPGVPPLTTSGKSVFAYDVEQGIRPGNRRGNVLLNAHTWPDGSALGNRLLAGLGRGDRILIRGDRAVLCYRVTERVEVLASRGLPRYYAKDGPHQLAIVVCSGRRLGPGVWEKRTIWFASPAGSRAQ